MTFVCSECGQDQVAGGRCARDGGALADSRDDPLIGQHIGSYRVIGRIGSGGMGTVYKALHPQIGSRVAIKVLASELALGDESVSRFFAEARAANLIRHEGIINVLDMGRLPDGGPYMLMELLDGTTLAERIEVDGPLSVARCVSLLADVLDALGAAHRAGIIHRDIKPHNVFVTTAGRVKLLDFGVAKLRAPPGSLRGGDHNQLVSIATTAAGVLVGTPHYCSPEQALALPLDARSDLYAVGVMAYEMLTARHPFEAETLYDLLRLHIEAPPPSLCQRRADIPFELERWVLRALAKDPDERHPSAEAMRAALLAPDAASLAPTVPSVASDTRPAPPPFSGIATQPPLSDTARAALAVPSSAPALLPAHHPPSQPALPPPLAPAPPGATAMVTQRSAGESGAAPRPSHRRTVILWGALAALVLLGVGAIALAHWAGSGDETVAASSGRKARGKAGAGSRRPSRRAASTGEPPAAGDLSRFDATRYLGDVRLWAEQRDATAKLVMLHIAGVDASGRVNLATTNTRLVNYHFLTDSSCIIATVNYLGAAAIVGATAMCGGTRELPRPRCRVAEVVKRGAAGDATVFGVTYARAREGDGAEWMVSPVATGMVAPRFYPDDC